MSRYGEAYCYPRERSYRLPSRLVCLTIQLPSCHSSRATGYAGHQRNAGAALSGYRPLCAGAVRVNVDSVILPDGEQYKAGGDGYRVYCAVAKPHGRDTTLVALGGVIGDLTGFAAASYQRGVRFIRSLPPCCRRSTRRSAANRSEPPRQNMIGAFWQPVSVVVDLNCLKTLPKRELASGLAEVIKYGVIWMVNSSAGWKTTLMRCWRWTIPPWRTAFAAAVN